MTSTRFRQRVGALALSALAAVAIGGCSSVADPPAAPPTGSSTGAPADRATGSATSATPGRTEVGRFASDNPGSVNTYWLAGPDGLVIVDSGRNVAGGEATAAELRRTGLPVAAVLVTHPHPDHVGGLGSLHAAFPEAPIYASQATAAWMREDPLGFYDLARRDDPDFPSDLTFPDTLFAPGAQLEVGGLALETAEFSLGESQTATVYYEPVGGMLFAGDLTDDAATPALLEGHTCGWLTNLELLRAAFPAAVTIFPGHGDPGTATEQIAAQETYLRDVRRVVSGAVAPSSASGAAPTPEEQASAVAEIEGLYPGYPPVASLPDLLTVNVQSVAKELAAEAGTSLPAACRS